jgi:hypothetical protein
VLAGQLAGRIAGLDVSQFRALDTAIRERSSQAAAEAHAARETARHALLNLERARTGRPLLHSFTSMLMEALGKEGIEANPLCELVESIEPEWHAAVEVILGPDREAIVVPPAQAEAAMEVARRLQRGRVVDTRKASEAPSARRGTLARLVVASTPEAQAYLNYRLGHVHCADTVQEALKHENAITRDLFQYAGWIGRSRHSEAGQHMLAQGGLSDTSAAELAVEEAQRALSSAENNERQTQNALVKIDNAVKALEKLHSLDIAGLSLGAEQARENLAAAQALRAEAIAGSSVEEAQLRASREAMARAQKKHDQARTELGRCQHALFEARKAIDEHTELTAEKRLQLSLQLDTEATWLTEELRELYMGLAAGGVVPLPNSAFISEEVNADDQDSPTNVAAGFGRLTGNEVNRFNSALRKVMADLQVYSAEWGASIPNPEHEDQLLLELGDWVREQRDRLERSELTRRRAEAEEARKVALEHLGNDYLGRMSGAVDEQRRQLKELNDNLKEPRFHGMHYRFISEAKANYLPLLKLIEDSAIPGFDLPLFDKGSRRGVGNPHEAIIAELQRAIFDPTEELGELADPRQWFTYDIEMTNEKTGSRTTFSKRQGTGSGGQVQAPFYVAMCSALAATSYMTPGAKEGGIALAILDEAFQRMDSEAIGETVRMVQKSGLQLIVAVPDNQRPVFLQFAGTMLDFYRDGTTLSLTQTRLKDEGRAVMARENPATLGFEGFKRKKLAEAGVQEAAE